MNLERLAEIQSLKSGAHMANKDLQMCVMEAAAYVAGEPWSDHPACVCPVITEFMISWNDSLRSDAERVCLLKPLIPLIVGTKSSAEVEERRSYMVLDWMIRVQTSNWLDMVPSLHEWAKELRELDAIVDMAGATAAGVKVRLALEAAEAARAAAWAAAGDAAGSAARAAAWAAAGAAAWAAAGDAAWAASGAAARAASGAALSKTVEWLKLSAVQIVKDMCAVKAD